MLLFERREMSESMECEAAHEERVYFDDVSGEFVVSGGGAPRILHAAEIDDDWGTLSEVAVDEDALELDS